VDKQGGDFILIMKNETVAPGYNGTRQRAMREGVASHKKSGTRREKPDEDEVEDGNVIAEVEEEIMPGAFFVLIKTERKQIETNYGIGHMYPPKNDYRVVSGKEAK
jgi:hypothetical protein